MSEFSAFFDFRLKSFHLRTVLSLRLGAASQLTFVLSTKQPLVANLSGPELLLVLQFPHRLPQRTSPVMLFGPSQKSLQLQAAMLYS